MLNGDTAGGRFGHAISKAGDLNGDSFDGVVQHVDGFGDAVATARVFVDVVISAPYAGDGVVYVYHGSASGIVESPVQV